MSAPDRILQRLRQGPLTPLEAWRYGGVMRVAYCIHRLRRRGHVIRTDILEGTNHFGEPCKVTRYTLVAECPANAQ